MFMSCEGQLGQRVPFLPTVYIVYMIITLDFFNETKALKIFKLVNTVLLITCIKITFKPYLTVFLSNFSLTLVTAFRLWYFYRMSHFIHNVPLLPRCCPTLPTGGSTSPPKYFYFIFINCRKLRTVPPQLMALYVTYTTMNLLARPTENVIVSSIKRYKKKIESTYLKLCPTSPRSTPPPPPGPNEHRNTWKLGRMQFQLLTKHDWTYLHLNISPGIFMIV